MNGLLIDNFAGGGGASLGIEWGAGRPVDIAINHDPLAIAMHRINHPHTRHLCESVWDVDPREVAAGRDVALCWFSPDCKHFSKAKGGKPVEKKIRGLAWVAVRWAATVKPVVIVLENVEEFLTWGPLQPDGKPCPRRKGRTFQAFIKALERQGYNVEHRMLKASEYGAGTSRKRLFLIARCDGQPIVWPEPTHGDPDSLLVRTGILKPWHSASEYIYFSLPCPSIFETAAEIKEKYGINVKRPLAENTLRRIARGMFKFVLNNADPFIIPVTHHGDSRVHSVDEPLRTITGAHRGEHALVSPYISRIGQTKFGGDGMQYPADVPLTTITSKAEHCLVSPTLIQMGYGEREGEAPRVPGLDKPIGTIVASGKKHALVSAFLSRHFGQSIGHGADRPLGTITAGGMGKSSLVTSHLVKLRGTSWGQDIGQPMPTITAGGNHIGEVRAFLLKYYGTNVGHDLRDPMQTITSRDRFGLVTIHGQDYQIVDIGLRMLRPHELFAAQGFPREYIIDHDIDGNRFTDEMQVRLVGNSVPPQLSAAIVMANIANPGKYMEDELVSKVR